MRIKSFSLFESVDDTWDIVSVVKDMLLELNDLDYTTNCVIRRMDGHEYIRISIVKPISNFRSVYDYNDSFKWDNIKSYMDPIIDYLEEEDFKLDPNRGDLYADGTPFVISKGTDSGWITRCEMWFIR